MRTLAARRWWTPSFPAHLLPRASVAHCTPWGHGLRLLLGPRRGGALVSSAGRRRSERQHAATHNPMFFCIDLAPCLTDSGQEIC